MLILALAVLLPSLAWPGNAAIGGSKPMILAGVAAALAVLMLSSNIFSTERIRRFFLTGPNLAILLFLGWTGLTWFDSAYKSHGLQVVLQLFAGAMVYFAVVYRLPARRNLQKLNGGLIAGVIASVGVAALLFAQHSGAGLPSAFGNVQLFAGFLVVTLPMLIVAAQTDDNPTRKIAAQFATVIAVAALLMTQVRTSWIAALVGVTVLGVLAVRTAGGAGSVARQKHQVLLPALVIVGAFALFFLLTASGNAFLARVASLGDPGGSNSLHIRFDSWKAALMMGAARPLEGWGIGSFPWWSGFVQDGPAIASAALWSKGFAPSLTQMAHNLYLQLFAETGIFGLGLYAAILIGFFARSAKTLREKISPTRRWMIIAAVAAISAQMVDALANPAWQIAEVSLFFWLVLGMGVAATRPRAEREEAVSLAAVESRPVRMPMRLGWGMAQVAMLAAAVFMTGQVYADHEGTGGGTVTPSQNEYTLCVGSNLTPTPIFMDYPAAGFNQIFYTFTVQIQQTQGAPPVTVDASTLPETTYEIIGGNGCIVQGPAKNQFLTGTPGRQDCLNQSVTIRASFGGAPPGHPCQKDALIVFSGVLGQGGQTFGTTPGPGPDIGGDKGGGAGLIIAGIAGAGLLFFLLGRRKKRGKGGDGGGDDDGPGRDSPDSGGRDSASLPKYERITSIRTSPTELLIQPSEDQKPQKIHVLVQLDGKPKWYDVTDHRDADFQVSNGSAQLVSTVGNQEQYRIERDRLALKPLTVVASFRGMKAETQVRFVTPFTP